MSLINLVADLPDVVHKQYIRFMAIYDILHISVDIARQVVVKECADISVLHD
jgi:hypothetical protein